MVFLSRKFTSNSVFSKTIFTSKSDALKKVGSESESFFKIFDSKNVFWWKNNSVRIKFSRKARKHHLWCSYGVNWSISWVFESEISNKKGLLKNSFTWKPVASLNFRFRIWFMLKKHMIQNLTCSKNSNSKTA